MALVKTLLTAIVRTDGDALVMHVGEKPYVVTAAGNVELSSAGLNLEAMSGMLTQLLPADAMRSLSEFGAVEHHLQPPQGMRDAFTVVAARGGDDIWIEIRRKRAVVPTEVHPATSTKVAVAVETFAAAEAAVARSSEVARMTDVVEEPTRGEVVAADVPITVSEVPPQTTEISAPEPVPPALAEVAAIPQVPVSTVTQTPESVIMAEPTEEPEVYEIASEVTDEVRASYASDEMPATIVAAGLAAASAVSAPDHRTVPTAFVAPREPAPPAVVLPMARIRRIGVTPPPPPSPGRPAGIERLLRVASTRGASALYLTSQSRPFLRVDGDMRTVDGESALTSADVEAAVVELMPDSARDAYGRGEPADWVSEFDGIGRVRCSTFKDYRGAGALFQLISAKPMSAEQLGFTREIQQLATESDGLVLVAGPRGGGKSTLVAGLVDLINGERGGYVITLERQISIVHENRHALVSQREVHGEAADIVAVTRAALRENPDVLVIEDLYVPDVIQLALEAAGSGLLVFFSVTAASTVSAIADLVEVFPPDRRPGVQATLAERLRGAVSQVLLRKNGGGLVAAREVLLITAAVTTLIGEGQFAQLAVALDSGRRHGMVALNDALYYLLQSGDIDVREAYRKTDDRAALLALLKRDGFDASFVERLA